MSTLIQKYENICKIEKSKDFTNIKRAEQRAKKNDLPNWAHYEESMHACKPASNLRDSMRTLLNTYVREKRRILRPEKKFVRDYLTKKRKIPSNFVDRCFPRAFRNQIEHLRPIYISQFNKHFNIEKHWILEQRENIEGYTEEMLIKVYSFVKFFLIKLEEKYKITPQIPRILPGSSDSFDIVWKLNNWEFAINLNIENNKLACISINKKNKEIFEKNANLKRLLELYKWATL